MCMHKCGQTDCQRKAGRQGAAMAGKEDTSTRVRATVHFLGTPPSVAVAAPSGEWAQTSFPGLWDAYSDGIRAPAPLTSRGFSSIIRVPLIIGLPAGTHGARESVICQGNDRWGPPNMMVQYLRGLTHLPGATVADTYSCSHTHAHIHTLTP